MSKLSAPNLYIKEDVIETNVCRLQIHAEHTNYFQEILEFQIHD